MLGTIKNILLDMKNIDGWKINETITEASELFFIKKELDMNRGKNVHKIDVTVYKNFEENGNKFKGSSRTRITPSMDKEEIKNLLNETSFAATFVKNQYYPLVKPTDFTPKALSSKFSEGSLSKWLPGLVEGIFLKDNHEKGGLNSCELFLNKTSVRIVNSEGVDVSFAKYNGDLEFITNWTEGGEEIELYKNISFSDYNPDAISKEIDNMLVLSREKAIAVPTPSLKDITVLLSGEPVKEFFSYYYAQSNARSVYENTSTAKIDKNIQGEKILGDTVTMVLDPLMTNSSRSTSYDNDGYPLNKVTIFEKGVLKRYWGDNRYCSYLDIEPTGNIENILVEGGSKSLEKLKEEPYIELLAFSDFQMNSLTGDFAGEIRLGRYYDGKKVIPVTGGSISGNVKDVQRKMFLSKELQQVNNFIGPKTIQLFNINIAGN